ncbi:uncharacterized protein AB9W97_014580 isoform 2-T2 [Spinachia spinachia]
MTEGEPGGMGATCNSWRTSSAVIIILLQIQAWVGVKTAAEKHDQWHESGRFSVYDNTTRAFFIVRVDHLTSRDSGTYRCTVDVSSLPRPATVVQLNVSRGTVRRVKAQEHLANLPDSETPPATESSVVPVTVPGNKFHLSLLVTAVVCVAAMMFICLFTLCLMLAVSHGRPAPQRNKETTSDYETMIAGVTTEPSVPASDDVLALPPPPPSPPPPPPPPPPDRCSHFTAKHRESTVSIGLGDYVDADVPKDIDPYQHLELSQLEAHVYDRLSGPLALKKQINSCYS